MTFESEPLWRILLVEDEETISRTTAEALERRAVSSKSERATVERVETFDEALGLIEERKYDLIILDIRDQAAADAASPDADDMGDEALTADRGLHLYNEIRQRRFIPIVFYSAVAHLASSKNDPPFVTVVSKLEDDDGLLRQKVTAVFDSQLPLLNRALAQHVDGVLRDFMIGFVEENWVELAGSQHRADLAYLMVRRLARALDATFVADLAGITDRPANNKVHPTRLYIMPPLADPATGDLYRGPSGAMFILLTPTCDLVDRSANHSGKRKAEYVTMASCLPLSETAEYRAWLEAGQPDSHKNLEALVRNNRQNQPERFYFLPAAWGTPDLLVDLQRISSFPYSDFAEFDHVATLDDPYAQSVVAQLGRFSGRVGTPDIDTAAVVSRLKPAQPSRQEAEPDGAPQPATDTTAQAEPDAAPQPATDTTAQAEPDAAPQPATDTTAQAEPDAAPQPATDTTAQAEPDAAPQPATDTTAQAEPDAAPQPATDTTAQAEPDAAPQPATDTTAQAEPDAAPQPATDTTAQADGL